MCIYFLYILDNLSLFHNDLFSRPAKKHKSKKRTHEEAIAASDKDDMIKHGIFYKLEIH
jgi:hypothetical protein